VKVIDSPFGVLVVSFEKSFFVLSDIDYRAEGTSSVPIMDELRESIGNAYGTTV